MVDLNFNFGTTFYGVVRDGKIFNQNNQEIGVTTDFYNQAIETAKGFEKILYDKGILKKPKTTDELNQEMQEMMKTMSATISSLSEKIDKLEKKDDKQRKDFSNSEKSGS